jgi:hypothetical protein
VSLEVLCWTAVGVGLHFHLGLLALYLVDDYSGKYLRWLQACPLAIAGPVLALLLWPLLAPFAVDRDSRVTHFFRKAPQ